jgi:hypothetical protein
MAKLNQNYDVQKEEPTTEWSWACDEQEEFFSWGPSPILASGGFNSGKTVSAIIKLLYLADRYPGYRCVIARRFYSELRETTMQTFFKLLPERAYNKGGHRNDSAGVVTLNNGSRFTFLHLDRPDSTSVIRGLEINSALLDQAEEIHEEVFDNLEARLGRWDNALVSKEIVQEYEGETGTKWPWKQQQSGKLMPPSYMLLTCNPDNETHWLWRRFHHDSDEWKTQWRPLGYKLLTFDSRRNKFADEQNLKILQSKDDAFVGRYVRGEWGNPEGVLFKVSTESILEPTLKIREYLKTCRLVRVLDHGDSAPTCCIWAAIDKFGNIFVYREYYLADTSVRDHRSAIYELSKADKLDHNESPKYHDNISDPTIHNKVPRRVGGRDVINRWTVAEEYQDTRNYPKEDAIVFRPGDNNEMSSRERVRDLLRVDMSRTHPVTETKGAPRLYFVKRTTHYPNGCFHTITEVKAARRVQVGSMNGRPIFGDERDETIPDHGLDCVRYLANAQHTPLSAIPKKVGTLTWDGYSKLTKEWRRNIEARENNWK